MKRRGRGKTLLSELDISILKSIKETPLCITELMKKIKSGNKDISKRLSSLLEFKLIKREKSEKSRKINYFIADEKREIVEMTLIIFSK